MKSSEQTETLIFIDSKCREWESNLGLFANTLTTRPPCHTYYIQKWKKEIKQWNCLEFQCVSCSQCGHPTIAHGGWGSGPNDVAAIYHDCVICV